jgi:hypothetical protein
LKAGVVRPGLSEWAMPPFDQARVTTMKSGSLLVVGLLVSAATCSSSQIAGLNFANSKRGAAC